MVGNLSAPPISPSGNKANRHPLAENRVVPSSGTTHAAITNRRVIRRKNRFYSRFVKFMKFMLPATALTMVLMVVLWPKVEENVDSFRLSVSSLTGGSANTLSMINARYFGTDENNQPFTITADTAEETQPGTKIIELDAPKADITLEDGTWLVLASELGFYSQHEKALEMLGAVNLFHDGGYEIHTKRARVDFVEGVASSTDPVSGHGPFGELQAEGFRLFDKGKRIFFTGKSRMVLRPNSIEPQS